MKTLLLILALSTLTSGESVNFRRYQAASINIEYGKAAMHGNVVMKLPGAIVHAEDAELVGYTIYFHGESSWEFLPVRSYPDAAGDSANPPAIGDPARLHAAEIRKDGDVTRLHGSVMLNMPGIRISATDVDFNTGRGTATIHGDASLAFMKARVEPDDNLGPLSILP